MRQNKLLHQSNVSIELKISSKNVISARNPSNLKLKLGPNKSLPDSL